MGRVTFENTQVRVAQLQKSFCPSVSEFEWNKALIIRTSVDRLPGADDIQTRTHMTRDSGKIDRVESRQ